MSPALSRLDPFPTADSGTAGADGENWAILDDRGGTYADGPWLDMWEGGSVGAVSRLDRGCEGMAGRGLDERCVGA